MTAWAPKQGRASLLRRRTDQRLAGEGYGSQSSDHRDDLHLM
jgi:hypothetical protein